MIFVMTGFRDKDLKKNIEDNGGVVNDTVSSKTSLLIAKDLDEGGSKIEKAQKLKIPIMSLKDFLEKF
jgi:NAD-dependent DNA ligase